MGISTGDVDIDERDVSEHIDEQRRRRRRIWRAIWIGVGVVIIAVLAALGWVASKGLTVKSALEAAQGEIANVQAGESLETALPRIGERAREAADAAGDPVWGVFEGVPIAGDNLRAARLAAESLDSLANDVALPLLDGQGQGDGVLSRALPIMTATAPRVSELAADIVDVGDSPFLIDPVRFGVDAVAEVIVPVSRVLKLAPPMLGSDGARNYLLVFQNNAETLPLGGSAASQTLIQVDKGSMQILNQAGSRDFDNGNSVEFDVDQSALDLYSEYLRSHVNTTVSRPDFPTAAQLLTLFWNRDIDQTEIDGVVSVDPLALQRVLKATGSIQVGDVEIDDSNAVDILLSKAYAWFDPTESDAFFALTAERVFDRVGSGQFDLGDMLDAVTASIDNGDILFYTNDEKLTPLIRGERISGALPSDNAKTTTVGVYFRDTSESKIDYYMKSSIDVTGSCDAGASEFSATAGLHLDLDQAVANELPAYVISGHWGAERFRTEVFVYGPPGTTFQSASVDGVDLRALQTDIIDLGRPVAKFEVFLTPGESASVTAVFAGDEVFAPLELRSTPMVQMTDTTVTGEPCS